VQDTPQKELDDLKEPQVIPESPMVLRSASQKIPQLTLEEFQDLLMDGREVGLERRKEGMDPKGWGVFTTKVFRKGEYICRYKGENISVSQANKRSLRIPPAQCFMYYVERHRRKYDFVVDASNARYFGDTLGRNINHNKMTPNISPRVMDIPRYNTKVLYFVARRDIQIGEELCYHYDDRRKGTDLGLWGNPALFYQSFPEKHAPVTGSLVAKGLDLTMASKDACQDLERTDPVTVCLK